MDTNIPSWDQYFMNLAIVVGTRSKDPNTKVGSVLVNEHKRIVGTGYNGMPEGLEETPDIWQKPEKYKWVLHSELNSILHSTKFLKHSTLYTTMYPCPDCSKAIVAAGIKRVVYLNDAYKNEISEKLLIEMGKIEVVKLNETW